MIPMPKNRQKLHYQFLTKSQTSTKYFQITSIVSKWLEIGKCSDFGTQRAPAHLEGLDAGGCMATRTVPKCVEMLGFQNAKNPGTPLIHFVRENAKPPGQCLNV